MSSQVAHTKWDLMDLSAHYNRYHHQNLEIEIEFGLPSQSLILDTLNVLQRSFSGGTTMSTMQGHADDTFLLQAQIQQC